MLLTFLHLTAWVVVGCVADGETIYIPDLPQESYHKIGDLNIGVLIPVHLGESGLFCGSELRGLPLLQRIEAIAFAIDEINNRSDILPNHTLGYFIFDDCYTDLTALAQSLRFSRTRPSSRNSALSALASCQCDAMNSLPVEIHDVIGVIGSESSITTVQMANLMTAFQIPQISYLATTPALSNKAKYPYFQRVVPSDSTQARVIIELMARLNWTFIYVMVSEGAYGEGLFQALERTLREESFERDICFAEPIIIRQDFRSSDFDSVVYNMIIEKAANVTLIITPQHEARKILRAAKRMVVQDRLTWIATDAWARDIHSLSGVAEEAVGTLSINIHSVRVPKFDEHFKGINGGTKMLNPWVDSFWKFYFNCSQTNTQDLSRCAFKDRFADHPEFHPDVMSSLVFDTVQAFAHTADVRVRSGCGSLSGDQLLNCVKFNFANTLRHIEFKGEAGEMVKFDSSGDRMTTYHVYNIQRGNISNQYNMVSVGEWNHQTRRLDLNLDKIVWSSGRKPMSNCSRVCGIGEGMELQQKRCCWNCVPCAPNQYTRSPYLGIVRCYSCGEGKWPDKQTRTLCVDIVPRHLTWHDVIGLTLGSLASVGLSLCVLVIVTFILNHRHQLIKACSRELSYYMLFGICTSYCVVFTFILEPTDAVCFINQMGVIISFTLTYTPLTVKTIRIYRIFESGRKMNRKPICVGASSQLIICVVAFVLHVIIIVVWSLFDAPVPSSINTAPGEIDLICSFPLGSFLTSMCLNVVLLIICSYFAFKARKLPDNFNESRFITFCAYSTVVLWLAFIPGYFLTESIYRALFLALMLIANGLVLLIGLFFPKIYAVYFVEKSGLNIKSPGRVSTVERSQINHIGHFIQDVEGSAVVTSHEKSVMSITPSASGSPPVVDPASESPLTSPQNKTEGKDRHSSSILKDNANRPSPTKKVINRKHSSISFSKMPRNKVKPASPKR